MKIFDKMGREHDSVEAALAAEAEYDKLVAEEEARKKKLTSDRAERAKEVEEAFKEASEANKKYVDLLNKFVTDYGSYHKTISGNSFNYSDLIDRIFNFLA